MRINPFIRMIYLEQVCLPEDRSVDFYFSVPEKMVDVDFLRDMLQRFDEGTYQSKASGLNSYYPWYIFYQRLCDAFQMSDITIFYGGNGSGKTTLLNIIAQKLGLNRSTLYNRSPLFDDYLKVVDCQLSDVPPLYKGRILTSDDVFDHILCVRKENQYKDYERNSLAKAYYNLPPKRGNTFSKYLKKNHFNPAVRREQSNGETAYDFFVEAVHGETLLLLDEPENSLSAPWQKQLALFLQGAVREFRCQLIISTHSPFLLSIPGAKIYDLDATPITAKPWYRLENVRCYYELFKRYEELFTK